MCKTKIFLLTALISLGVLSACSGDGAKPATSDSADGTAAVPTPMEAPAPVGEGPFTGKTLFTIFVSDLLISRDFYQYVCNFQFLGFFDPTSSEYVMEWPHEDSPPMYAAFAAGYQRFGLQQPQSDFQEEWIASGRYFFQVNNLEEHHEWVKDSGVTVSPIMTSNMLRRFYVVDPDDFKVYFAVNNESASFSPW